MRIVSTDGVVVRVVRGSGARSKVGRHHAAVGLFLGPEGGETDVLSPFEGVRVAGVVLESDPDRVELLLRQYELDFLEIYSAF